MNNHETNSSAIEICQKSILEFKKKSDHNKNESLSCFVVAMSGTLGAPLFVTLGDEIATSLTISPFYLSKLLPSVLSLAAAFATAWLQLRNPQKLWAIYRTAQRDLEESQRAYQFKLGDFSDSTNPEKLLIEKVTSVYKKAHSSWLPLVPTQERKNDRK